jgi:hypothetical protein
MKLTCGIKVKQVHAYQWRSKYDFLEKKQINDINSDLLQEPNGYPTLTLKVDASTYIKINNFFYSKTSFSLTKNT